MSSRLRKLARRAELTPIALNAPRKHGCTECRSVERRTELIRLLITEGRFLEPSLHSCPVCLAAWRVEFGSDPVHGVTATFNVPVLS